MNLNPLSVDNYCFRILDSIFTKDNSICKTSKQQVIVYRSEWICPVLWVKRFDIRYGIIKLHRSDHISSIAHLKKNSVMICKVAECSNRRMKNTTNLTVI